MFSRLKEYFKESIDLAKRQEEFAAAMPDAQARRELLERFKTASQNIRCPHNPSHILSFVTSLLKLPPDVEGCIVEAGTFKGGSAAKFSVVAKMLKRELVIFDSFEGLPENKEEHKKTISGTSIEGWFEGHEFCGALEEVQQNIGKYGEIGVCRFIKGWFDQTMPHFDGKICAAYIDVDLASSTRTCIRYLYPRLSPGGVLVSQDGDFPLVIDVFRDDKFWEEEVGCARPHIDGLGSAKMLTIVKPGR